MMTALLDGRALPAGELAFAAGITPQTASSHLARLIDGGLVTVETQGRHRYYRLGGPHVAEAMERLGGIRSLAAPRSRTLSPKAKQLRFARRCYDHLAGQLGVALTERLVDRGFLAAAPGKTFTVTPGGVQWFAGIGVDVAGVATSHRGVARQCLDWTERTHHLAGPLGVKLLEALCASDWLRRSDASRAVLVTQKGHAHLWERLGIDTRELAAC